MISKDGLKTLMHISYFLMPPRLSICSAQSSVMLPPRVLVCALHWTLGSVHHCRWHRVSLAVVCPHE